MKLHLIPLALAAGLAFAGPAAAETKTQTIGGDVYVAGSGTTLALDAQRDVFAAGASITVDGAVAQDVHAAGFDVEIEADTAGDLYALGATVRIRSAIGEDLSATGFSVRTSRSSVTQGNARLAGATVTIDGPVKGTLSAAGGEIILNAPVDGDVWLVSENISFGPDARIAGVLHYSAPDEINIPLRVIPADRVTFDRLDQSAFMREMRESWAEQDYPVLPTFMSILAGFIVTLAFFILIGAICLAFMPRSVARLREIALGKPGLTLLSGVIGLSALFGLVPVSAMTIIALPLVPIVLLALVVLWTLGYILGAYVVALRVLFAIGPQSAPTTPVRLVALAIGVTFFALLNFIPFLGWIANFTLVLLGVGAMTFALFEKIIASSNRDKAVDTKPGKQP